MKVFCYLLLFTIFCNFAYGQNEVYIIQGDSIDVPCSTSCTNLSAQFPKPLSTNTYTIDSIQFAPASITGTAISFTSDDYFSNAIPIGFSFCFFGIAYTNIVISDNGHLTFDNGYANLPCSFNTQQALPAYNNAQPDNAIYAPFLDSKLSLGGNVTYATQGTYPNRKFVVTYSNIPYFNNNCNNTGNNTYQVILYEITNKIECHISNKVVCNTDSTNWLNYATIGIQNINASIAYTVPGKNASRWSASNKAYVFNPAGSPTYQISWFKNGNISLGSTDNIIYCPSTASEFVTFNYNSLCGNYIASDTIFIKTYKPTIDSISKLKTTCINSADGCVTVYATTNNPPFTYSVNNGTFSSVNPICNLSATQYIITIKDALGCSTTTNVGLTSISLLNGVLDTMIADSCPSNIGVLAVHGITGTKPYTYLWSNGSTDSMITNLVGDITYTVIIKDSLNCIKPLTYYLPRVGVPKITAVLMQPICHALNGIITLTPTGNNVPYSYAWSNGSTTNPLTGLAPNTYSVTITSANGCTVKKVYVIYDTLNTLINITNKKNTTCGSANGTINMLAYNAIAPYTYYVNNVLLSTNIAYNLAAGTYTVKGVDANGCSKTSIVTIGASIGPTITFNPASPNCDSINGKLGITITNGTAPFIYNWYNGSIANNVANLDTGKYYVTITDSLGCVKSDTFIMSRILPPHLQIIQYTQPLCNGDSNGSVQLNGIAGIPSYKYSLDSINFSAVAQVGNISAGIYTIYIKDASSCIRDTVVTFTQPSKINIAVDGLDTLICFDDVIDTISVFANSGFSPYLYALDNNTFNADSHFYNLTIGNHIISVKDNNNCVVSESIIVPGPSTPLQVSLQKTDVPCFENNKGEITAIATGGWGNYKYNWSNGDSATTISNLAPTKFILSLVDDHGCQIIDSATIQQLNCCIAEVPNAFTPNSFGPNNILKVISGSAFSELRFSIFNRFGEKVFETTNAQNGWNGMYKNVPAELGTYYYVLDYKCPFITKNKRKAGDILLIR